MTGFSLTDVGLKWFTDVIEKLIEWFVGGLEGGYNSITRAVFETPLPRTDGHMIFGSPMDAPWVQIHGALVGGEITVFSLLLLVVCVQGRHVIRIFNFGSTYEAAKARKTAWTGAFLILTWYWVGVTTLYLVDGFTIALLPDVGTVLTAIITFLDGSISNLVLALTVAVVGGFAMWLLQAVFFLREILLYVYLYAMPIGLAVAYGHLPVVSRIAKTFCMKFVPLAIMPLPVAMLFRGYEVLFSLGPAATVAPESTFLQWIVAISLPILALYLSWKVFSYATPMTASAIRTVSGAAMTAGVAVGAGAIAGPHVGATAARWGPKAAAGYAASRRFAESHSATGDQHADSTRSTSNDNVVTDAYGQRGIGQYRRTENDPGYY